MHYANHLSKPRANGFYIKLLNGIRAQTSLPLVVEYWHVFLIKNRLFQSRYLLYNLTQKRVLCFLGSIIFQTLNNTAYN